MSGSEGSEYDRLFYPFLFEGGKASIEDVLAQVRHSTLEKCREVLQEVLEEWLVLKIRDNDSIPRLGRISLPLRAA
jgi:hypothetical protein